MRYFSRFILFVTFLFAAASGVYCQETKDRIIVTVGVGADEVSTLFSTNTDYYTVAKVSVNPRIYGNKSFRLGGKFVFDRLYYSKRYSFGPEISYRFGSDGIVEPFGHFLIGKEYINHDGGAEFLRTLGAGVRVNLGYLVLVPLQIDSTRGIRTPFASPGVNQFSAAIGIRF